MASNSKNLPATATAIHSAAIHLLRALRKTDISSGIGPAKLSALSVLVFGGPQTLAGLAQAEQVKPPTMSRIVNGLEENGLVRKSAVAEDRRSALIHVTSKGKTLLEKARRRRLERLEELLSQLPDQDVATIHFSAQLIEEMLQQDHAG